MEIIDVYPTCDDTPDDYRRLGKCLKRLVSDGYFDEPAMNEHDAVECLLGGTVTYWPLTFDAAKPDPRRWLREQIPAELVELVMVDEVELEFS